MDRFDDIWKDRFNEEELPIGDWNTPDDEVWKGILPHVAPEKEKKRRWWWLWFGAGTILILTLTILSLPNNEEALISQSKEREASGTLAGKTFDSNVVSTGVNMIDESDSGIETNSKIESETISVNVSPSKVVEEDKYNNVNTASQKPNKIKQSNVTPILKTIIADTNTAAMKLNSPESSSFKIFKSENLKTSLDGKNEAKEQLSISELPSLEILLQKEILPIHDLSDLKLLDIDFPTQRKLGFGFSTGAVFWKHRVSSNYEELLEPFDFNYENGLGWQAALDINFAFNEIFEGTIGFQYEQINTTSGHNSLITYDLDNEQDMSNPLNGYALSLATPYGLSGSTFNLLRNQDIGANSADLLVDFHSTHVIKNISIPVGLNIFPLGKKNIWVPSVHVGFGTNYLASISNNIQSIETHHDAIQYDDSGSSTFVSPELEQWHFDYRLGLGVTYQLNTKSSVRINYDWSRGINPIFKLDNYNTRIDRHHISIGLTTKLHKP